MASTMRSFQAEDQFLAGVPALRVHVGDPPVIELHGRRVRFPTRHAQLAVCLLAVSGEHGVLAPTLSRWLWPDAPQHRLGPRVRTCLWQVRRALGDQSWRVWRRGPVVLLDLSGVEVVGDRHPGGAVGLPELPGAAGLPPVLIRSLSGMGPGRRSRRRARASSFQ